MSISPASRNTEGVAYRVLQSACAAALVVGLCACDFLGQYPWQVRVPIVDVGAAFSIADTTWFEEEETLFVFYRIDSREGLSINSVIELQYRTDDVEQRWIDITALPRVHTHVPVACGPTSLCGSYSTQIPIEPRDVGLRVRYHYESELAKEANLNHHVVATGTPHDNRSAVVYGVFDEDNRYVQWRLRHQFPGIRNQQAEELGLRRDLRITDVTYGSLGQGARDLFVANPYGYGAVGRSCPIDFSAHNNEIVATNARAVFDETALPVDSYEVPYACSTAFVTDALGEYPQAALAQKNPETREAFPSLRSPIDEAVRVPFMLEVCEQRTSVEHRDMQRQRLFLTPSDIVCIDDWNTPDFPNRLAARMGEAVDIVRAQQGLDMVLIIGLNRPDDVDIARRVEEALAVFLPEESNQSTPRVAGAFIFDSAAYSITDPQVSRLTLWCPSSFGGGDLDAIADTSARSCAIQPTTELPLGEQLELSSLPILPTEEQFEEFVEQYGVAQTGEMTEQTLFAPIRTPISRNLPVGDFGVATFFNNEAITPAPTDGFSYCADEDTGLVVFGIEGFEEVLPLSLLGEVHAQIGFTRYELGLFWEFPYLLQMNYESTLAAAVDIPDEIPFIAAFGIKTPGEQFLGSQQWMQDRFEVGAALTQCTRFCDHPTFDSSGVYNIDDPFLAYAARCYRPVYPELGDSGFPADP